MTIVNQIANFIITFAAVLTAGSVIWGVAKKSGKKVLDKALKPFNDRIDNIEKDRNTQHEETKEEIRQVQLHSDKNFLVRFLADVEQGNKIDEVEIERFYEVYKDYKKLGGNSYVAHKVEKLQKEGKL